MKNRDYWKERALELEQSNHQSAQQLYERLDKAYRQADQEIEKQIRSWYQKFAGNNKISIQEAKQWMSKKDLEEFKWNVQQYIAYGEENAINHQWLKQLKNASAHFHISRLEGLKITLQQLLEQLFGNYLDDFDSTIKNIYLESYYHSIFDIQQGFQIGWTIGEISQKKLNQILQSPWATDGKNFSERIWDDRVKLVNILGEELTRMVLLGDDPNKAIENITKKMGTSRKNAERLVLTESAYFAVNAQHDSFLDLDVKEYEIVEALDGKTCKECGDMDGKHYHMSEYEPGITAPIFHPRCRGCIAPYFDDEFELGAERAARGEDGKTYYIPANMTYKQWKKEYVKKEDLTDEVNTDKIKLTEKEERAFNGYLSSESYKINSELRSGKQLSEEQKQFIKELDSALNKMPIYKGTVYRSLSDLEIEDIAAFLSEHTSGKEIEFPAYTSTATQIYDKSFPIQYVIQSKTGRDIQQFNPEEHEILFLHHTKFKVNKVEAHTIFMEEV
ncbi:minor capsid protein [Clostridium facile]|uniref:Minor capsid protein n=1 Tax=Clostridium facile TaxID=2763035 RepID=A0ABR7INR8_9CLOT|nr:minor capsid protein [Clostridium facile]MBC5786756.1 minor capsid protein [Clostridium facile]